MPLSASPSSSSLDDDVVLLTESPVAEAAPRPTSAPILPMSAVAPAPRPVLLPTSTDFVVISPSSLDDFAADALVEEPAVVPAPTCAPPTLTEAPTPRPPPRPSPPAAAGNAVM